MRKFQYSHHPTILPLINQCTSRKGMKNIQSNTSKENLHPVKEKISNTRLQPAHFCLAKKNETKESAFHLDQLLQIKLLEPEKTDVPTIPKLNKLWVPKNVDMNKQTVKDNHLQSINKQERNSNVLKRKSWLAQKQRGNSLNLIQKTLNKSKIIQNETSKIMKASTKKNIPVTRQKIYSCRIALKNCVFPIHQKKYEQDKLNNFFGNDDTLSTINKKQESDSEDLFISFDSYTNMQL